MRTPAVLASIALVALALIAGASTSSANLFVAPASRAAAQGATRFTSSYTALTKCGSGMTKKEEKEAEAQGSDIPTRCKGPGGYDVYIY